MLVDFTRVPPKVLPSASAGETSTQENGKENFIAEKEKVANKKADKDGAAKGGKKG